MNFAVETDSSWGKRDVCKLIYSFLHFSFVCKSNYHVSKASDKNNNFRYAYKSLGANTIEYT